MRKMTLQERYEMDVQYRDDCIESAIHDLETLAKQLKNMKRMGRQDAIGDFMDDEISSIWDKVQVIMEAQGMVLDDEDELGA